jgi:hypothetical protein
MVLMSNDIYRYSTLEYLCSFFFVPLQVVARSLIGAICLLFTVKSNCWVRLKNELYAVSGDWINSYLLKGLDQGLVADKVLSCTTLPKYDICIFQDSAHST